MKKLLMILMVMLCIAGIAVAGNTDFATGSFTSAGTEANVSIGWTPRYVIVSRVTTTLVTAEWQTGMAQASCLLTIDHATAASILSLPTTSCISTYAGSTTAAPGFTLGTDANINVNGDTVRWRAWR